MFGISAFSQAPFASLGSSVFNAAVSEAMQASDLQTCIGTFVAVRAEIINLLDTPSDERNVYGVSSEAVNFDSTIAAQVVFDGQIDEDVQFNAVNSALQTATAVQAESSQFSDAQAGQVNFVSAVVESATFDAALSGAQIINKTVDEAIQVDDTMRGNLPYFDGVNEGVEGYDLNITSGVLISIVEDRVEMLSDVSGAQTANGQQAESVTFSESQAAQVNFVATQSEEVNTNAVVAAQADFYVDIDEDTQFNALNSGLQTAFAAQDESTSFSDTESAQNSAAGAISELVSGTVVQAVQVDFSADIDEDIQFDNTQIAQTDFAAVQAETARLLDAPSVIANLLVTVQEQIEVYDTNFARYLWELIDDPQNANWQNINSNTSPGWGVIDTDEPGGWQVIDTV